MAKLFATLCLISCLAGIALVADAFTIQGRVYCDTCRAGFETSATEYIGGAKVKLECKNYTTGEVTHTNDGVADASGTYNIVTDDNHEGEICEVVLVESPRTDCTEVKAGRDRARIVLASDSGITTDIRFANSLGFLIETPLPVCGELLQAYALSDDLN